MPKGVRYAEFKSALKTGTGMAARSDYVRYLTASLETNIIKVLLGSKFASQKCVKNITRSQRHFFAICDQNVMCLCMYRREHVTYDECSTP